MIGLKLIYNILLKMFNDFLSNLDTLINILNTLGNNNIQIQNIDHIFYINLEHRKDRKEQIENEIRKFDPLLSITERFNAIKTNDTNDNKVNGALGASKSHLEIVKLCKKRGYKNVLIFEDDFEFLVSKEYLNNLLDIFYSNIKTYSLILLGTNSSIFKDTKYKGIYNIQHSQTASGYIINESIYDKYIEIVEKSIVNLIKTKNRPRYAIDIAWKVLQNEHSYSFNKIKRIGQQRESFSDIECRNVNYKC